MKNNPSILNTNPAIGTRGDIHLYLPETMRKPVPFVLGIHGGSWKNGDQTSYNYLWPKLKPFGFGLVLASYRTSQEAPFPAAYEDLLQVLKWLAEHGAAQGLDVSRCALFGSSAGGHLAMLLATRAIAEEQPRPELRGVAQYCGIMDTAAQYAWDEKRGITMTRNFLGGSPAELPERYRLSSPLKHVHAAMPPVWMTHGTADMVVPYEQSLAMVQRLRELDCDVIFHEARGLSHTMRESKADGVSFDPITLLFEQDALRFFERTLLL